jgi:hypothetical protein
LSIDKWLSDKDSEEEKMKREEIFKNLSLEKKLELKKKKINEIVNKKAKEQFKNEKKYDFLKDILLFKDWLNNRTYLKGDINKIETWIENIYTKIKRVQIFEANQNKKNELIDSYKKIPPDFLDEKTRIALNKKLKGIKRTSSDNYYLRKLRNNIQDKLQQAKYYEILDKLLK